MTGQTQSDNPVNDAKGMESALKKAGFDVIMRTNVGYGKFYGLVDGFYERCVGADIALFCYSGHGVDYNKSNYLIPVDAKLEEPKTTAQDEKMMDSRSMKVDYVLNQMRAAGTKTNVAIIDACRNNPFKMGKSAEWGLGKQEVPRGSLVVFSAEPGSKAMGGKPGGMSVITNALVSRLLEPGKSFQETVSLVAGDMDRETNGRQLPYTNEILTAFLYLSGSASAPPAPSPANPSGASAKPRVTVTRSSGGIRVTTVTAGKLFLDGEELVDLPAGAEAASLEAPDRLLQYVSPSRARAPRGVPAFSLARLRLPSSIPSREALRASVPARPTALAWKNRSSREPYQPSR